MTSYAQAMWNIRNKGDNEVAGDDINNFPAGANTAITPLKKKKQQKQAESEANKKKRSQYALMDTGAYMNSMNGCASGHRTMDTYMSVQSCTWQRVSSIITLLISSHVGTSVVVATVNGPTSSSQLIMIW